jgi:hypothetical protein
LEVYDDKAASAYFLDNGNNGDSYRPQLTGDCLYGDKAAESSSGGMGAKAGENNGRGYDYCPFP